ncbi:MAG: hypothetical protein WDA27_14335 [Actinomycetota bacterium]
MSDPIFDPFAGIRAAFHPETGRIEASIPISHTIAQRMIAQGDGDLIRWDDPPADPVADIRAALRPRIDPGILLNPAQWQTMRALVARDIYLHRTMGVWSPFTRDIEAATAEWLES